MAQTQIEPIFTCVQVCVCECCLLVCGSWRTSFKIKMNAPLSRRAQLKRIQDFCTNRHLQAPAHTHTHIHTRTRTLAHTFYRHRMAVINDEVTCMSLSKNVVSPVASDRKTKAAVVVVVVLPLLNLLLLVLLAAAAAGAAVEIMCNIN